MKIKYIAAIIACAWLGEAQASDTVGEEDPQSQAFLPVQEGPLVLISKYTGLSERSILKRSCRKIYNNSNFEDVRAYELFELWDTIAAQEVNFSDLEDPLITNCGQIDLLFKDLNYDATPPGRILDFLDRHGHAFSGLKEIRISTMPENHFSQVLYNPENAQIDKYMPIIKWPSTLQRISFIQSDLSDESLKYIPETIERLDLGVSNVTTEGIIWLQNEMPDMIISKKYAVRGKDSIMPKIFTNGGVNNCT
ncbi:MAG: hypothetical protein GY915_05300 [bacterium]|nr:hypothetical protein [bacterium]